MLERYRIGIDVGGTNTDAVLMQARDVIAFAKRPTSSDVTAGAVAAVKAVLEASGVPPDGIDAVMVGTTHFVNAFVQRRETKQSWYYSHRFADDLGYTASCRLAERSTRSSR